MDLGEFRRARQAKVIARKHFPNGVVVWLTWVIRLGSQENLNESFNQRVAVIPFTKIIVAEKGTDPIGFRARWAIH